MLGFKGLRPFGIGVHQASEQLLVHAAPIHANAHGFVITDSRLDHLAKLLVVFVTLAHITGIDAVFRQGLGALWIVGQQTVAVVMEVTDQRDMDVHAVQLLADVWHRLRSLGRVDGNAHQLRPGHGQFFDLNGRANHIFGIGICHGLDAHRCITTDGDYMLAPGHTGLQGVANTGHSKSNRFNVHQTPPMYLSFGFQRPWVTPAGTVSGRLVTMSLAGIWDVPACGAAADAGIAAD